MRRNPPDPHRGPHRTGARARRRGGADHAEAKQRLRDAGFQVEDTRQLWGADRAFTIAPGGHRVELMAAPPPPIKGAPRLARRTLLSLGACASCAAGPGFRRRAAREARRSRRPRRAGGAPRPRGHSPRPSRPAPARPVVALVVARPLPRDRLPGGPRRWQGPAGTTNSDKCFLVAGLVSSIVVVIYGKCLLR